MCPLQTPMLPTGCTCSSMCNPKFAVFRSRARLSCAPRCLCPWPGLQLPMSGVGLDRGALRRAATWSCRIPATAYGTTFSDAGIARFSAAPVDGNMGGLSIGWSDGTNAGNKNFNIGTGGWACQGMGVSFTPVANKDYGMLYTFNRTTLANTFTVCEFDGSGNPVIIGTTQTATQEPVGTPNGVSNATVLSRLLPFTIYSTLSWKNIVIAPTILTLAQALGPGSLLPPPPGWKPSGTDGVTTFTAGMRASC
jgi:hypothetical protein